jgi:hypothetical protein
MAERRVDDQWAMDVCFKNGLNGISLCQNSSALDAQALKIKELREYVHTVPTWRRRRMLRGWLRYYSLRLWESRREYRRKEDDTNVRESQ